MRNDYLMREREKEREREREREREFYYNSISHDQNRSKLITFDHTRFPLIISFNSNIIITATGNWQRKIKIKTIPRKKLHNAETLHLILNWYMRKTAPAVNIP